MWNNLRHMLTLFLSHSVTGWCKEYDFHPHDRPAGSGSPEPAPRPGGGTAPPHPGGEAA